MPVTRARGLPTPTIAHEGNPRATPDLVVSGTLDGDVFVNFTPILDSTNFVGPIPAPGPVSGGGGSACTDDIVVSQRAFADCPSGLTVDEYKLTFFAAAQVMVNYQPSCGTFGAVGVRVNTDFDVTVSSGLNGDKGYGFSIAYPVVAPGDNPLTNGFNELYFNYLGPTVGTPISGLAGFVDGASTPCNFSGIVWLFDHPNSRSIIGYYSNQSLRDDYPHIVATGALPVQGDFVGMDVDLNGSSIDVTAFDSSGTVATGSISTSLITPTDNLGLVWVGYGGTGEHNARYTYFSGASWSVV